MNTSRFAASLAANSTGDWKRLPPSKLIDWHAFTLRTVYLQTKCKKCIFGFWKNWIPDPYFFLLRTSPYQDEAKKISQIGPVVLEEVHMYKHHFALV